MAKPTKAKLKEEGVALKSMVTTARKKTLNFALLIGKEGLVIETHLLKGPGVLRKLAKSNGGGAKGTMGQLRVEGKKMYLSVESEPPGNMPKLMKTHMAARGLPMKIIFELPGGAIMDDGEPSEDGDEQAPRGDGPGPGSNQDTPRTPETGSTEEPPKKPEPDNSELDKVRAALAKAYEDLKPQLTEKLKTAEETAKSTGKQLVGAFSAAMQSGNLKNAKAILNGLNKLLASIPEPKSVLDSIGDVFDEVVEDVVETVEKVKDTVEELGEDVGEVVGDFLGMELTQKDKDNKDKTDALKLPEAQQKELIKLGRDNPKSFEQTLAVLKKMQDDFGDLNTSSEGSTEAISAVFTAETKVTDLVAKINNLRAQIKVEAAARDAQQIKAQQAVNAQAAAQKALDDFKAGLPALASMSDADKLKAAKAANALINTLDAAKNKATVEKQALTVSIGKVNDLSQKDAEAFAQYETAKSEKEALNKKSDNLELKKTLLDSLNSGVLSPDAETPLSDEDRAAFVAAFKVDPKMAAMGLELASKSKDPALIAKNIGMMCNKVADGFADKDGNKLPGTEADLRAMAENALKLGARQGEGYFKGFEDYLKSGKQLVADPCGGAAKGADPKEVGKKRSAMVGGAMLDGDGKLDPTSDKAKAAMDHMLFHPGSLKTPAPAMIEQMQGTIKDFNDPVKGPQMKGIIDGIDKKPTDTTAKELIAKTNGTTPEEVDENSAKQAVLSAMFTPLSQGPVGSCFSTAPARKMRNDNPVKTMEKFAEIATTGVYTPAKGLPIKAVKTNNLPDGENPLMRSFEYSAATAGARLANSRERTSLTNGLFGNNVAGADLGGIKAIVGDDWEAKPGTPPDPGLGAKLQKAIAQKLTFKYNAKGSMVGGGGGDGSSREGGFELVSLPGETPILTKDDFVAAVLKISLDTCGETKDSEKGKKIVELVNDPKFIESVSKRWSDGSFKPWEMSSGGFEDAATEALVGGTPSYDVFLEKQSASQTPSERNSAMLGGMMTAFSGATTEMVSMGTTGTNANHAFNALPQDPSWDKIRPPNTEAKIQSELVEPGKKIANTEIEKEKTVALYEERIKALISSWGSTMKAQLVPALKKPPSKGMKPAELNTYLLEQTKAFRDEYSKVRADNTKADALAASKPFTQNDWDADEEKWQKASKRWIESALMGELVDALPMPEIKVADTNWGDNESHTFFVMSPDPITGELILWKKDEIKGTMVPAGDNWSDAKWDTLK